jgi:hypothetical protein
MAYIYNIYHITEKIRMRVVTASVRHQLLTVPIFSPETRAICILALWQLKATFERIFTFRRGPLMVAQWLRYCATNRKVSGSIQNGIIGIFH